MENTEPYQIIDSKGNIVLLDISVSMFDFFNDVDDMRQLYNLSRYTQADEMRDKLAERLDDVMRGLYTNKFD